MHAHAPSSNVLRKSGDKLKLMRLAAGPLDWSQERALPEARTSRYDRPIISMEL